MAFTGFLSIFSLFTALFASQSQLFLKGSILISLVSLHIFVHLFNLLAIIGEHVGEFKLSVSRETTLLHLVEFLLSACKFLISDLLGLFLNLLLASLSFILDLLLDSILVDILLLLDLEQLLLVVRVFSVLLV